MMINLQQKYVIRNETDIITTRVAVRDFAKRCGLSLRDQACISLVSSSVASILGGGKGVNSFDVEIMMESCGMGAQNGVRVSCIKRDTDLQSQGINSHLKSSYSLVDDIQTKTVPFSGIEVVVTKWDSTYKG